jgi:4-amino-4-deoxy-L-arabinose transferase-like glycosyltransferase
LSAKTANLTRPDSLVPIKYIHIILLVVLGLVILLPGSWNMPLLDRDEPRFARATVEMSEKNSWLIPYFNGGYRFDKPVLTYWLMRAGYWIFGQNELGARWHSIMSTVLIALVIYWAGYRWFSPLTGLAAAVGFLTCLQVIINGRLCVADMPMILCVAVSQIALYELLVRSPRGSRRSWWWLLYVSLGAGFLAKGPIAILVPALSALMFRFVFWRKPLPWRNLKLHFGLPVTLLIIGAWGVPALIQTHGLFWKIGMNEHVVKRGAVVFHGRIYSPFFYIGTALISLSPWIAFAGRGWQHLRNHWSIENAFMVSWFLAPYVIFTFYATQLSHYVMPGFPAFFLLLAQAFKQPCEPHPWMRLWFRACMYIPAISAVFILLLLLLAPFQGKLSDLRPILWGFCGLLGGLISLGVLVQIKRPAWIWIGVILIGLGIMAMGNGMRRVSPAAQLIPVFRDMPQSSRYMGYQFTEPTLVFYSDHRWEMTSGLRKVKAFLKGPGSRLVIILETEKKCDRYLKWKFSQLSAHPRDFTFTDNTAKIDRLDTSGYNVKRIEGLNLGRFSWVTLKVYYRID